MNRNNKYLFTHRLTGHPLLKVWHAIKDRCYNPKCKAYKYYGARGVTMCDEWLNDVKVFYDWAINNGWKKGLDLDKDIKAKELGVEALLYSHERCQFVTRKVNTRNSRRNHLIEYNGETKTVQEWGESLNIKPNTIITRLRNQKMSIADALTKPIGKFRSIRQLTLTNVLIKEYKSVAIASKESGISYGSITQCARGYNTHGGYFKWEYITIN